MAVEIKDMLRIIYDELLKNQTIKQLTANDDGSDYRIKLYDYPETADHSQLFILLQLLEPPRPVIGGSDQELSQEFTLQIDVQSPDRIELKLAQFETREVMRTLNFAQISGGLDEYFPETKRYVDARRYRGTTKLYDTEY